MKNLVYIIFLLVPSLLIGQTNTENYVTSTTYKTATLDGAVDEANKIESIAYYDGIGRLLQTINLKAGGGEEAIINYLEYDENGMQPKEYLPYGEGTGFGTGTLDYRNPETLKTNIFNFYNTNKYENTLNPYSENIYEPSPMFRVWESGAPGNDWMADATSDSDHTIKFEYLSNGTNEVRFYSVDFPDGNTASPKIDRNGFYLANELAKVVTKDENWEPGDGNNHTTHEFTNKKGQIVLKRNFNNTAHDTYYVYDEFGNLTFVIPPEGSDEIVVESNPQTTLDKWCYQYHYDSQNRLVWKKIPGKEYEQIVYDDMDRPILTRDANLRANGQWLFTKYDGLGRIAYTGIYTPSLSKGKTSGESKSSTPPLNEKRSNDPVTVGDVDIYYTNDAYPSLNLEVLTVNYYDSYVDTEGLDAPATIFQQYITSRTQGLSTVSKVRVLGTTDWTTTVSAYDEKGRNIYIASKNEHLNTEDVLKTNLDFSGKVLATRSSHIKDSNPAIVTLDYFTYDHMDRIITHMQQINNQPVELIAQNEYDELGQLISKKVGGRLFDSGYENLANVSIAGEGLITKNAGGSSNWNAGLTTKGVIGSQGGLHFTIRNKEKKVAVGFNQAHSDYTPGEIDFGFQFKKTTGNPNFYQVRIQGSFPTSPQNYQIGDRFAVEKDGGTFRFFHNDVLVYTHSTLFGSDVFGDVGMKDEGAAISDFVLYATDVDSELQKVDYEYTVRGWLKEINQVDDFSKTGSPDLFNFKINYTSVEGSGGASGLAEPLYNGNIAQTIWRTKNDDGTKRAYAYEYDPLNRITDAHSRKGTNLNTSDVHGLGGIEYDKNGNIELLFRNGFDGLGGTAIWDHLVYLYEGNRLTNVQDLSSSSTNMEGFRDRTTFSLDYTYDDNGNMKSDYNKGITSITYNHLNLPEVITLDPVHGEVGGTITYTYDALGTRLKKVVNPTGSPTASTEYAGMYNYQAGSLQFMNHPEGYLHSMAGTYEYVYQYKDHLGNIRLAYSDSDGNGVIDETSEIIEESNYYPFGLKQKGYNSDILGGNDAAQELKFQGQELEEDLGKDTYAFQWRDYDGAIGRFNKIDRFAEKYNPVSPYSFTANNPLKYREINGDSLKIANNDQTKEYLNSAVNKRNREFVKVDDDGNVTLDFGDLSEKKINRRLKNDKGLEAINNLVNATDSEGNSEKFFFEVSFEVRGIFNGEAFTFSNEELAGTETNEPSFISNFSTTEFGGGYPHVLPEEGFDGAIFITPGKMFNRNPFTGQEERVSTGAFVRHELRESFFRTHDKKPYKEAHEAAGGAKSFTRFEFDKKN